MRASGIWGCCYIVEYDFCFFLKKIILTVCNTLIVTDKFNPDLDIDSDQSVLDSTSMVVLSLVTASGVSSNIGVFSIQSEEAATSLELSPFFNAADELVKSQVFFYEYFEQFLSKSLTIFTDCEHS